MKVAACSSQRRMALRAGVVALVAACAVGAGFSVLAEDYPSQPIRMIVAFAPGGGTDILGRLAAKGITDALGVSVVVENRAGGGGAVGTTVVAKAPPDGYTLITSGTGAHAINPALFKNLAYDPVKDFTPVSLVGESPYLMLVSKDLPVKTVQEFISLAKSKPGELTMASSGNGGMPHLTGELFQLMTGTKFVHAPYKGTGVVFPDLIAGRVQVTFADIAAAYPHIQAGNVRILGISSPQRSPAYPDVPSIAETVPGFDAVGWFGVFAPAGTPAPIVQKLSTAIAAFVKQEDVRKQMAVLGVAPVGSTPEAFDKVLRADIVRWAKVVQDSGAKVD